MNVVLDFITLCFFIPAVKRHHELNEAATWEPG